MRPARILLLFTCSLFFSLYMPFRAVLILVGLTIPALFLLHEKISRISLLCGTAAGLLIHTGLLLLFISAGSGLPLKQVDRIVVELADDSFLSGSGNTVLRGKLLRVGNSAGVECSARGRVLIIARNCRELYFQGQKISLPAALDSMEDSEEFPFIAFAGGDMELQGWSRPLFQYRKKIIGLIDRGISPMPAETASLFSALFRGNSDLLDRSLKKKFTCSGVPHLLALSGFHVAIVVALCTFLLQKIIGKRIAYRAVIPFLFFYLFIAGFSPSLIRAVIMFFLAVLFRIRGREISLFSLLLVTSLIQISVSPLQALGLSFQLSYLALAGILLFSGRIRLLLEQWVPGFILLPLCASVGAQMAAAPLLLFKTGALYPVGVLSSLVITPVIVLFMWLSLFAFFATVFHCPMFIISPLFKATQLLYHLTDTLTGFFSRFPSLDLSSHRGVVLYLTLLLLAVLLLYGRRQYTQIKLRFSFGNKGPARNYGTGTEKEMESEFPC